MYIIFIPFERNSRSTYRNSTTTVLGRTEANDKH